MSSWRRNSVVAGLQNCDWWCCPLSSVWNRIWVYYSGEYLGAPWKVKKHCFWWWFLGKVGISTRLHRVISRNMKTLPFVQFWGLIRVYVHQGRVRLKYVRIGVLTAGFLRTEVFRDLKLCRHNLEDLQPQTQLVYGIAALKYSSHSLSKVSHECFLSYPFQEAKNPTTKLYEGWNFNSGNYLFTTDTN